MDDIYDVHAKMFKEPKKQKDTHENILPDLDEEEIVLLLKRQLDKLLTVQDGLLSSAQPTFSKIDLLISGLKCRYN